MDLLKNRAVAVAVGATVIVTGANLTAYAAGGHLFGGTHHAAGATAAKHASGPKAYQFVIPKGQKVPFAFKAKNLPKGRYAVSLSIATTFTATAPSPDTTLAPFCGVSGAGNKFAIFSFGVPAAIQGDVTTSTAINQGTGMVKVSRKGGATFMCTDADQTFNQEGSKNIVVFTPLSKVVAGKLHSAPVPVMKQVALPHFGS